VKEFENARLPDARLVARLGQLVAAACLNPAASIPRMSKSESEREANYRFLSNERVEFDAVLAPHLELTSGRAVAAKQILALHDTTTFKLAGSRGDDLGYINTGARGFFLHASIALRTLREDGSRECLGVLGARTVFREELPQKKKKKKKKNRSGSDYAKAEGKESDRWWLQAEEVERRLNGRCEVLHVADSEADSYTLLSKMVGAGYRFVTRMARDRRARSDEGPWSLVSEVVGAAADVVEREVPLPRRGGDGPPRSKKSHPPREARVAKLGFAAMPVEFKRPPYLDDTYPAELKLNVVRVHELDAPEGVEPVEWYLFTTEPTNTREKVLAIVDAYRARWAIEDFFKALKTGCAYEKRQLEGRHAWLIALAISLPLAWRLLQLRQLARDEPDAPATKALTKTEVNVLRHLKPKLPPMPTLREAMMAVAALGGHIKNNGEPGWLVLHRGMSTLQPLAQGVELALAHPELGADL